MEVPLTSFVDFIIKTGRPKLTCAKKIKKDSAEEYDPMTDYYKRFREAIQEMHKKDLPKKQLSSIIGHLPASKRDNYQEMVGGYRKFLGSKDVKWFKPPRKDWQHSGLTIPINPELGLEIEGEKHVIKLYLKAEKPSKDRLASILALMYTCFSTEGYLYAVLDVRNARLYLFEDSMLELMPLVEGEADSLSFMLNKI
ncbi:hypothetical protein [Flavihumibacter fluvii]|uniref:hypothetical protein n=1 Tax=Flavihumibacter fluvii TaxID=2838157 RepID=UPI001BDEEF2F|nr:hypothetical protein [Flavihumibacter fluvii]ULQ52161.1 hypothetical protein KJS93_18890 [Flavihumibacter fluvii]